MHEARRLARGEGPGVDSSQRYDSRLASQVIFYYSIDLRAPRSKAVEMF